MLIASTNSSPVVVRLDVSRAQISGAGVTSGVLDDVTGRGVFLTAGVSLPVEMTDDEEEDEDDWFSTGDGRRSDRERDEAMVVEPKAGKLKQ